MSMPSCETPNGPMYLPASMCPGMLPSGDIFLMFFESNDSQDGFAVYLGHRHQLDVFVDLLDAFRRSMTAPDDARELEAPCPTPRDVFGGRRQP